jgi:hypothetical protein
VGTTDFTAIGASSNTVGVEFVATGAGSGTGTALVPTLIEFARYNSFQIPYTASTTGNYGWLDLGVVARDDQANAFTVGGHTITNDAAGTIPLQIKGASGQSTQLFELLRNDNALLFRVRQGGQFGTGSMLTGTNLWVNNDVNGASIIGAVIRGAASQSANILEIQNSASSVLTRIDSSGRILTSQNAGFGGRVTVGSETVSGAGRLVAQATSASDIPFVSKGFASQTANLLELQDSSANILVRSSAGGALSTASTLVLGTTAVGQNLGQLTTYAGSASTIGAVIRAAASQTANLQEWQNSAGTILANITSGGSFVATGQVQAGAGVVRLISENSGGQLQITRGTAAATNPGANIGRIYFRDGTTAGTLKLVVRAGAAGAETTILDNIPQ